MVSGSTGRSIRGFSKVPEKGAAGMPETSAEGTTAKRRHPHDHQPTTPAVASRLRHGNAPTHKDRGGPGPPRPDRRRQCLLRRPRPHRPLVQGRGDCSSKEPDPRGRVRGDDCQLSRPECPFPLAPLWPAAEKGNEKWPAPAWSSSAPRTGIKLTTASPSSPRLRSSSPSAPLSSSTCLTPSRGTAPFPCSSCPPRRVCRIPCWVRFKPLCNHRAAPLPVYNRHGALSR